MAPGGERFLHAVVSSVMHDEIAAGQHGDLRELWGDHPTGREVSKPVSRSRTGCDRGANIEMSERVRYTTQNVAPMRQERAERDVDLRLVVNPK